MKDDQLAAIRDELIAELATPKSSAAKFEGALLDWRERNVRRVDGRFPDADQVTAERAKSDARTLVNAAHARAVANMRQEFQRPEYAGKTPEELQAVFTVEQPIYADFEIPTAMADLVTDFYDSLVVRPERLIISNEGVVIAPLDDRAEIQAALDNKIAKTGKAPDELRAPRTERREIGRSLSPWARCWCGIPYVYNVPPLEVIAEALK